jgi:hypothetical protein
LFRYVNDQNPIAEDRIIELLFIQIQTTLKRDLKKWEKVRDRNKTNGLNGGRPKNPSKPKKPSGLFQNPDEPKKPVSVSVSVRDSVSVREENHIPSFDEFKQYAIDNKPNVDVGSLKLKYESWKVNGWKTGGDKPRPIKNWKTTLLNTLDHLKESSAKVNSNFNYGY